MEEMISMGQLKEEIKQEIKNIVNEMKLVAEDIKGATVDESLQYLSFGFPHMIGIGKGEENVSIGIQKMQYLPEGFKMA